MSKERASAWDGYRRWRKVTWLIVPLAICMISFDANLFLTVPLVLISITALVALTFFDCPKCGGTFFYAPAFTTKYSSSRTGGHHPFARKCVHCGLPKWEEPPEKPLIYSISRGTNRSPNPKIAERLRLTKFLTLILRDDPKSIGLRLDANGWADVDDLLKRANLNGIELNRVNLGEALAVSENHRFEWDQPGNRIRRVED